MKYVTSNLLMQNDFSFIEETVKVLKLSLTEFSLPKFYQLFGISKVWHFVTQFAPEIFDPTLTVELRMYFS